MSEEKEKKDPWLNWLALTTLLLAVCATFATSRGGGHSTKSLLSQSMASDTWSHYQSKSIKGVAYAVSRDRAEADLALLGKGAGEPLRAMAARHAAEYARYKAEQAQLEAKAHAYEADRDANQAHGKQYGKAIIYLQIAIVLSGIAALLKKPHLWIVGIVSGLVGIVYFINGFFLFFS